MELQYSTRATARLQSQWRLEILDARMSTRYELGDSGASMEEVSHSMGLAIQSHRGTYVS